MRYFTLAAAALVATASMASADPIQLTALQLDSVTAGSAENTIKVTTTQTQTFNQKIEGCKVGCVNVAVAAPQISLVNIKATQTATDNDNNNNNNNAAKPPAPKKPVAGKPGKRLGHGKKKS